MQSWAIYVKPDDVTAADVGPFYYILHQVSADTTITHDTLYVFEILGCTPDFTPPPAPDPEIKYYIGKGASEFVIKGGSNGNCEFGISGYSSLPHGTMTVTDATFTTDVDYSTKYTVA